MVGPNGVDIAVLYLDWVGMHWEGHTWPGKANELVCGHFRISILTFSSSTYMLISTWYICIELVHEKSQRVLLFSLQSVRVLEAAWLGVSSQQLASLPAAERAKVIALRLSHPKELLVVNSSKACL